LIPEGHQMTNPEVPEILQQQFEIQKALDTELPPIPNTTIIEEQILSEYGIESLISKLFR
jgi:hypothetical protein